MTDRAAPLLRTLCTIRNRCRNPRNKDYPSYGGKGVECRIVRWQEIEEAIGPRPKGMTLDRIDPDGHYEIGNLRWATPAMQMHNRRDNKFTVGDIKDIRREHKKGVSQKELAARYNVKQGYMSRIVNHKIWKIN